MLLELQPTLVIELGTFKGASVLHMAGLARQHGLETSFVCIDTWLGSNAELWLKPEQRETLMLRGGYPTMYRQFIVNVLAHDAGDRIYPLPLTSTGAARLLAHLGIVADAVYVDAGHEEEEVRSDLELYWKLLSPDGLIFGDDYHSRWPGVVRSVDRFCKEQRVKPELDLRGRKWLVRKSGRAEVKRGFRRTRA